MLQLPVSLALIAFGTFKLLNQKTDESVDRTKNSFAPKRFVSRFDSKSDPTSTHHLQAIICPGKEQVLHK